MITPLVSTVVMSRLYLAYPRYYSHCRVRYMNMHNHANCIHDLVLQRNMQEIVETIISIKGASAAPNDYTVLCSLIKLREVQSGTTPHPLNGQREIQSQEYVIHLN